ncbi:MAG: hypothetical protein LN573_05410 [Rickettsia endosymbiont of Oxypoda opaca]|nr:hypothetical protein [Rickettsia endosymbiont of Oxypoda opaca]
MATNQRQTAFYVIPGVVAEHGQASSGDVLQMLGIFNAFHFVLRIYTT